MWEGEFLKKQTFKTALISIQIEQYIESVFPTQDPRLMAAQAAYQPAAMTTDEAKQKELDAEAKQDTSKLLMYKAIMADILRIPFSVHSRGCDWCHRVYISVHDGSGLVFRCSFRYRYRPTPEGQPSTWHTTCSNSIKIHSRRALMRGDRLFRFMNSEDMSS